MKFLLVLVTLITLTLNLKAQGQNEHPMKISMVSVLVADPAKAFQYYTEVLGFVEVMYAPEHYIAIVKSPLDMDGASILLEPTEPGGLEIVQKFKKELYDMGMPVITFSANDIYKIHAELKSKGVVFKREPTKTDFGYEAVFDDDNGNYIQLIQLD